MEREWRVIGWAHNYEVSNYGEVRRVDNKELKRLAALKSGILVFSATNDDKKDTSYTVASAVAETFIEKPKNITGKMVVVHKDRNRSNNRVDNLQYVSLSDYIKNYTNRPGPNTFAPIAVRCLDTGHEFYSINEPSRIMGIDNSGLSKYLRKGDPNRTYKGYHFVRVS